MEKTRKGRPKQLTHDVGLSLVESTRVGTLDSPGNRPLPSIPPYPTRHIFRIPVIEFPLNRKKRLAQTILVCFTN